MLSLQKLYIQEIETELRACGGLSSDLISERDLASLPELVQRFFRQCGYVGQKKMSNARIYWEDVNFKLSAEKLWIKLDCRQFNSVPQPARIVYMASRLFGVVPFEGRDKYQQGHGNMLIKLAKLFTVGDANGKEMDASALVTVLSETALVPTYALQPYMRWEAVDKNAARATLTFGGIAVSGTFFFTDSGEFNRFETNDRYYSKPDGSYLNLKWSAIVDGYVERGGLRVPDRMKAVWQMDSGECEYFNGRIAKIEYDVMR